MGFVLSVRSRWSADDHGERITIPQTPAPLGLAHALLRSAHEFAWSAVFELRPAMYTILFIILILLLLGALPVYPYSRSWGYYPSGGVGLILIIILLLVLFGVF